MLFSCEYPLKGQKVQCKIYTIKRNYFQVLHGGVKLEMFQILIKVQNSVFLRVCNLLLFTPIWKRLNLTKIWENCSPSPKTSPTPSFLFCNILVLRCSTYFYQTFTDQVANRRLAKESTQILKSPEVRFLIVWLNLNHFLVQQPAATNSIHLQSTHSQIYSTS